MTTRNKAPLGAPCWADLWTSDVEGSRKFYGGVFGWEAQEPSPEFGGYFMFTREGVPVAGGMGDMGDMKANNSWKIYFDTPNIVDTLARAQNSGAQILMPADAVADLGTQSVLLDSNGAQLGAWQAGTFPGFTVLEEHGAPSWFELHARNYDDAVNFYRDVFNWQTTPMSDSDEFRYTTASDSSGEDLLAGIMEAGEHLPEGVNGQWSIYWYVNDVDETTSLAEALGGAVISDPVDTPFGRLASMTDPSGAQFKLRGASD
jgi:predicted enzyme related to lactoylglutathione lyase